MRETECFASIPTLSKVDSDGELIRGSKNMKSSNCIVDGIFRNVNVYNL